jgi:hypothetical protein
MTIVFSMPFGWKFSAVENNDRVHAIKLEHSDIVHKIIYISASARYDSYVS